MNEKTYEFDTVILNAPDQDAAYIEFPYDAKAEFGAGRVAVHATFEGEPYDGQLVKMGTECHIIGIRKDIRAKIGKQPGDTIRVTIREREKTSGKITSVDEYIAQFPPERQELLRKFREVIRENAPCAEERMRWEMPTYWQGENLVHFASGKNHIGLYPGSDAVEQFADRLEGYKTSKGAIQFPVNKPIDFELITDIVRNRVPKE
jgi:uncharacterized protein YdhG (YjbR/CyaY superfamily)